MCIRDSKKSNKVKKSVSKKKKVATPKKAAKKPVAKVKAKACLLYTSDAADERSSVDLGGRRIIKKKKTHNTHAWLL